jgi:hypothetical protein
VAVEKATVATMAVEGAGRVEGAHAKKAVRCTKVPRGFLYLF